MGVVNACFKALEKDCPRIGINLRRTGRRTTAPAAQQDRASKGSGSQAVELIARREGETAERLKQRARPANDKKNTEEERHEGFAGRTAVITGGGTGMDRNWRASSSPRAATSPCATCPLKP